MRLTTFFTVILLVSIAASAVAQTPVTIRFDNSGEEAGVTPSGTTEFSFMGSNWSGGVVATRGVPALYASGSFSYEVTSGTATVMFDQPAEAIEFFYVHGSGLPSGTATALDAGGNALDAVDSQQATGFNDPANFVSFNTAAPISAIEFSGGAIDNFSYALTEGFVADFRNFDGQWVTDEAEFQGNAQGITFDFLVSANLLFGAWFTYTDMAEMPPEDSPPDLPDDVAAPDNRWLTFQLTPDGNTASGPLLASTGGQFDSPPTGFQDTVEVGTMTVTATACDAAMVSYELTDPPISREFMIIPLEKRVAGVAFQCVEFAELQATE